MKNENKNKNVPSPFDAGAHKTERTGVAILMHWMRAIIEKEHVGIGMPDVETSGADRKMPDAVFYDAPGSQKVLCVLEAKMPYFDVFSFELVDAARKKANQRKAKYFVTTNFKKLIWWSTEKANNPTLKEEEQIIEKYVLSEIENMDDMEHVRHSESIKRASTVFLKKLFAVYHDKEPEPKQAIDDFLIFRLHEKIRVLTGYYKRIIDDRAHKEKDFAKNLSAWFIEQGWEFAWQTGDFEKAARQTAYLLVNKILFYDLLQAKRPQELDPLQIPESLTKGDMLQTFLQGYFKRVLRIDYETIYTADFIDSTAFPDKMVVVDEIKELIRLLQKYDFSKLGFDIIGRIFERLIPQNERHNLGQYFTPPDVVDLILSFCLYHEDDRVLDPSCGAGTFLVRTYQQKRMMNQRKSHEDILESLWGCDIAKFPAHLATINLAIGNLGVDKNYPNILHEDFFNLHANKQGFDPGNWRKLRAKTLGLHEREIIYPRWFDAVVGNPPYTRQEEITEMSTEAAEYKNNLIESALVDFNDTKIASIGKRAGIHAYFFVHGTKFLKENGFFGFIVSNSWMDTDYGKGLQEFFLKHYKIVCIIESNVERWFEAADINTCVVILQKCSLEKDRAGHIVRFCYLKKPLRHFIPAAHDMWEKQIERRSALELIRKTILAHDSYYENEEMRIYPIRQKDLWDEGYERRGKAYIGSKWSKYLRAPKIFFGILEKCKNHLSPLRDIADIRRGFTTGANDFFYLTEEEIKRLKIERQFWQHKDENGKWRPNKIIKSPREAKSVILDPEELKNIVLFINKDRGRLRGKNILVYIEKAENKKLNERSTLSARKRWYEIERREPWPILFPMIHHDRQLVILNKYGVQVDHNLFEIKPKDDKNILPILGSLLSTVSMLFKEFSGRINLGEGALKTEGIDIQRIYVPKRFQKKAMLKIDKFFHDYPDFSVPSIFEDIDASKSEDIQLEEIASARRELDSIIMGDILGLDDNEQLEVYKAVFDLVKSRINKARSVSDNGDIIDGVDGASFKKSVLGQISGDPEE